MDDAEAKCSPNFADNWRRVRCGRRRRRSDGECNEVTASAQNDHSDDIRHASPQSFHLLSRRPLSRAPSEARSLARGCGARPRRPAPRSDPARAQLVRSCVSNSRIDVVFLAQQECLRATKGRNHRKRRALGWFRSRLCQERISRQCHQCPRQHRPHLQTRRPSLPCSERHLRHPWSSPRCPSCQRARTATHRLRNRMRPRASSRASDRWR